MRPYGGMLRLQKLVFALHCLSSLAMSSTSCKIVGQGHEGAPEEPDLRGTPVFTRCYNT